MMGSSSGVSAHGANQALTKRPAGSISSSMTAPYPRALSPSTARKRWVHHAADGNRSKKRGWEDSRPPDVPVPFSPIPCSLFKTIPPNAGSLALSLS